MLFAESDPVKRLEHDVKKHLYDRIVIRCKDGTRHEVYGEFNVREYVDRMFDAHTKVREATVMFACCDINELGITLKKCHFFIQSQCMGERWYTARFVLRANNNKYNVILESCDEPGIGRKQSVVCDTCDTATKFRSRRKVT